MQEYKETVKRIAHICFIDAKESQKVVEDILNFGVDIQNSPLFDVTVHCIRPMAAITPADIFDSDEWYNDFWYTGDFDKFWNKYYEGSF